MEQKTKKQHYVPQMYLKLWGITGENQIHVYDKELEKARINNIEDVASQRYFYDVNPNHIFSGKTIEELKKLGLEWETEEKSQGLEYAFAEEIEKPFSGFLRELISNANSATPWHINNCYFVFPDEKADFSAYLAFQFMRTKRVRDSVLDAADCLSQAMEEMKFPESGRERYLISKEKAKELHVQMLVDAKNMAEVAAQFCKLTWMLGLNRTKKLFYTTDNPIATYGHLKQPYTYMSMNGLSSKGVEVFFPLSPNIILIMVDGSYHTELRSRERRYIEITNTKNVDFYNSLLSMEANRFVFSKDGDFSLLDEMKKREPQSLKKRTVKLEWGGKTFYPREE